MDVKEGDQPAATTEARSSELAIVGGETVDHTVPADVLLRALGHLQRIVHLIAAAEEKRPIRERAALPEAFRRRYGLRCGVPKASSFAMPLSLGLPDLLTGLVPGPTPLDRTMEILRSASRGEWADLARAVPDPRYLPRVMNELQAMLPRPGDRWGIALRVGTESVSLDSRTYRAVRGYLSPDPVEDAVMTVTGDLVRVDIAGRRVVLRYRPTGREIPCYCEESALEGVLENWSEPIQVTGRFTLDRQGHPKGLSGVTRVEPIDLSPMTFERIEWGGRRLILDPPLTLEPTMDEESGQLYMLVDEDLGVDVFARTRAEVIDELAEQLMFQWDTYAREVPERLTPGARRLREALLARIREDEIAPK